MSSASEDGNAPDAADAAGGRATQRPATAGMPRVASPFLLGKCD